MRMANIGRLLSVLAMYFAAATTCFAGNDGATTRIRAGLIGLDTSHVVAFTQAVNDPKATGELAAMTIVAAYPGGSPDIPDSWDRVKGYTADLRGRGVDIVDSIDALLKRVDVVLLESLDGRRHLPQAIPVIAAGKPLFIDKPMTASLADAMRIFRLAKKHNVPCFSSSSLRFSAGFQAARNGTSGFGEIRTCTAWSPMSIEPHHPDLFWYGIHGVETLYTIMGPGCETVERVGPQKVVGQWKNGRTGTFIVKGDYGATVEGTKKSGNTGKFDGYVPLLVEIVKFFKTGKAPVNAEETLEVLAFMEAADESKRRGGEPVSIQSVMQNAEKAISKDQP
jgi:hypothetical protein